MKNDKYSLLFGYGTMFPMESSDEERRRLQGKRAGNPGEGFADVRTRSHQLLEDIEPAVRELEELFRRNFHVICFEPVEETESLGQQFARLSRRRAREKGYEDNPEQLLLHCPKCGLMNDFTIDGRQVYYLSSEFRGDHAPQHSTTHHRIRIMNLREDRAQCQCGKCGEQFFQRL